MITFFNQNTMKIYLYFLLLFVGLWAHAQEVRVIDKKGTIRTVTVNNVTEDATAPIAPVEGDVWFDTTTNISKVYDADTTSWNVIDPDSVTVDAIAPTTPTEGDIWFDTIENLTKVWDGTSTWQPIQAITAYSLWDNDLDTGIQVEESADDDHIRFDTRNQERMVIDSLGNLGIGTSTPSYTLTVSGTAHVSGAFYDSSTDSGTLGQILSSTATGTNWIDPVLTSVPQLNGVGLLTDDGSLLLDDGFSTFVQGDYAYVVSRDNPGLQIIDISDPANPVGVGQLLDDGNLSLDGLRNVVVQGDYAYTISVSEGFQIIDVSDPTEPVGAGRLEDGGTLLLNGSWDLDVQGNYAYVTSLSENGIQIIDISDPNNPEGVGQLADTASLMLGGAFSIVVQGNYAYVTSYIEDGFQVIDVSDPTNPVSAGQLAESSSLLLENPYYVFVEGNYAYVPSLTEDGIQLIDITDPNNPVGVGQLADSSDLLLDGAYRVFTQGNYAYVTAILEGLQVIDISDPANPVGVAQLADDGTLHLENARGLFVQGNQAYVTGSGGFQVVQLGSNELYGLDVGALKASSLQVDNHAQFNNLIDVKGGLSVGASAKFEGNVSLGSSLRDATGDAGTAGQVLSSTSTGTNWIDISSSSIVDADGNTQIQVEESSNEDIIRFDTAGIERMTLTASGTLGIGTLTPTEKLTIQSGDILVNNDQTADRQVNLTVNSVIDLNTVKEDLVLTRFISPSNVNAGDGFAGSLIDFRATNGPNLWTTAQILGLTDAGVGAGFAGGLAFATQNGNGNNDPDGTGPRNRGANPVVRMVIQGDGDVGIGVAQPTAKLDVNGTTRLRAALLDANNDPGTAGQVLTSTVTGTDWIDLTLSGLTDLDGDTQIQVEESPDDDTIRFDALGEERVRLNSTQLTSNVDVVVNGTGTSDLILEQDPGLSFTPLVDLSHVDSSTLTLLRLTITTPINAGGHNFADPKVTGSGITVRDATTVAGNLGTSYWIYRQLGSNRRFGLVEFRLVGSILQGRYRTNRRSSGAAWTDAEQTDALFSSGTGVNYAPGTISIGLSYTSLEGPPFFIADQSESKVGIGTVTPEHTLTVSGTAQITGALHDSNNDPGTAGQVLSSTVTGTDWTDLTLSGLTDLDGDTQIQVEESTDDDYIRFDTRNAQRMVIDSLGNVGIGTNNPDARLHVVNGHILVETSTPRLTLKTNGGASTVQQRMVFETNDNARGGGLQWNLTSDPDRAAFFGQPYQRNYLTYAYTETGEEIYRDYNSTVKFKIRNTDGFTSIAGNHNPTKALDVGGEARIRTLPLGAATDSIVTANVDGDLRKQSISNLLWDNDLDTGIQLEENADDDTIRFDTDGTERMTITASGTVGIGTTSPTALFQVQGTASALSSVVPYQITSDLTAAWTELVSDTTGLYLSPDAISFGTMAITGPLDSLEFGFETANTPESGFVISDSTPVKEELLTSYWVYLLDGIYVKAVQFEFRLNGTALEVRRVGAQFRSDLPGGVATSLQNEAYFSGTGWTTSGADYTLDLVRVNTQSITGSYANDVLSVQGAGRVGINTLTPTEALDVNGTTRLRAALRDANNDPGTAGQVLSSTVTGTDWTDLTLSGLTDLDGDTQIQVEEGGPGTDDDTIRFDTDGTQRMLIDAEGQIGLGGVVDPQAELHFSNNIDNRKLILWQNTTYNDDHQFYGFGISNLTQRYHVPDDADHVFFAGTSSSTSQELVRIKGTGNVGIGGLGSGSVTHTLTVSGTAQITGALHDSNGDAGTAGQVLSSTVTGTDWINTTNTITNELIFDGEDDPSGTYDDYYYISMLINGTDWKVVRYDKTDVNAEAEATITNNPGVTAQPTTLAACIALIF